MSGRLGVFIKTLTRCVCLSRARGRNQRPVNNLHNASETDISFSDWLLHTFWLQLLAFAILTTLCPPSAAYPPWAIKTLHKPGQAKLLQTNTQSNRIAKNIYSIWALVKWGCDVVLPVVFLKAANLCSGEDNFNAILFPDAHHYSRHCQRQVSLKISANWKAWKTYWFLIIPHFYITMLIAFSSFRSPVTSGEWRQLFQMFNSTGMKEL